jgi:hypothetical protein
MVELKDSCVQPARGPIIGQSDVKQFGSATSTGDEYGQPVCP